MLMLLRLRGASSVLAAMLLLAVAGCNDAPSIVGSEIVPGTDTIYAHSSIDFPFLPLDSVAGARQPLINGTYFLLGNTQNDQARVLLEFLNYPKLGAADSFSLVSADLLVYPQDYKYGDTTDATVAFNVFELSKEWSVTATWDSIWSADGASSYYSTGQPPVATFNELVTTPADSVVRVPFNKDVVKRWLVNGQDSLLSKEIYGVVLHPTNTGVIRQFRNLSGVSQRMKLRVITSRTSDPSKIDTNLVECAVGNYVNTPAAEANERIVQGARVHKFLLRVSLDSLPPASAIFGGTLRLTANDAASTWGSYGRDEIVSVVYQPLIGSPIELSSRADANGVFTFVNLGPLLQLIRREGGTANLIVKPAGAYETWRMNRVRFYGLADAPDVRPRLTVAYSIIGVFDK